MAEPEATPVALPAEAHEGNGVEDKELAAANGGVEDAAPSEPSEPAEEESWRKR